MELSPIEIIIPKMVARREALRKDLRAVDNWLCGLEKWTLEAKRLLGYSWDGKIWYPLGTLGE